MGNQVTEQLSNLPKWHSDGKEQSQDLNPVFLTQRLCA